MRNLPSARSLLGPREDDGFTLVEILVVIIIIGILAAIAIPIFLNQQRTARDSATIADVRNLATNTETALAADPEALYFSLYAAPTGGSVLTPAQTEDLTTVYLAVGGTTAKRIAVAKTDGTNITITGKGAGGQGGHYVIQGYNLDGQEYKAAGKSSALVYDSANGGLQM